MDTRSFFPNRTALCISLVLMTATQPPTLFMPLKGIIYKIYRSDVTSPGKNLRWRHLVFFIEVKLKNWIWIKKKANLPRGLWIYRYWHTTQDKSTKLNDALESLEQLNLLSSFVDYLHAHFRVKILHCHAHFVKGLYHQKMKSLVKC